MSRSRSQSTRKPAVPAAAQRVVGQRVERDVPVVVAVAPEVVEPAGGRAGSPGLRRRRGRARRPPAARPPGRPRTRPTATARRGSRTCAAVARAEASAGAQHAAAAASTTSAASAIAPSRRGEPPSSDSTAGSRLDGQRGQPGRRRRAIAAARTCARVGLSAPARRDADGERGDRPAREGQVDAIPSGARGGRRAPPCSAAAASASRPRGSPASGRCAASDAHRVPVRERLLEPPGRGAPTRSRSIRPGSSRPDSP